MPWGIAAGVAGSVLGSVASSAINGGGGTGATNANGVYQYIPTNQAGMDTSFNNYYGTYGNTLNSYYSNTSPISNSLFQNGINPINAPNYQAGANQAQGAYYGAGTAATAAGQTDYGLGNLLNNAAQSWGLNGSELANLQAQSTDAANAQSYLRGIQNTPYGASVATNAVDQTNLNYALQQAQTQQNLANSAVSAYGAGTQQYGAGAGYYGTGASLPYQAGQNILGAQNQAVSNYYGQLSPYLSGLNQLQGNALQYLGYGNTANNTAAGNAQYASGLYGGLGNQIGQAAGQAYSNWSGGSGGTGAGGYNFSMPGGSAYSSPSTYDYYSSSPSYVGSAFGY